ncbi:MAG: UvrD-helicase domain-containing protein, partial [Bacteroidota bacterium]
MSFLDHLNPVQRDAVLAADGPVLVVAGAGSGKTRVLTYRAAHLIGLTARPGGLLALTFTNKAAEEMRGRIRALTGDAAASIWMGTFHSIFARILRREGHRLGYNRSFTIYDRDDSLSLVRAVMTDRGIPQQQFPPSMILARISQMKNRCVGAAAARQAAQDPPETAAADVYGVYEKRLRGCNAMDFDDLLLRPLDLFREHPSVLREYQDRFSHLLVDEYQDTNRVQFLVLRELARGSRNICVVGDDAQSIYGFRGADIRNILEFEREYPDCRVFRLEQNYRSTGSILAAAGSVIRRNAAQIPKSLWTRNPAGEPVTLTAAEDDGDEGRRIVDLIREECRREKLDLGAFAVLYRTNAQSRALEDALRRAGIPYGIVGGTAFYRRKEVKDILAYLRVLVNPRDDESLLRILNVPARSIGPASVARLRAEARPTGKPLEEVIGSQKLTDGLPARTARSLEKVRDLVHKYRGLRSSMSAGELARSLTDEIGILPALKAEGTRESLERRENILELLSALSAFCEGKPEAGLEDFLGEVSLVSDVDGADFSRNAVTLMTLHAAKGLEFPVVFITGLEEGLLPIATATGDPQELEEERRLLYVGMTRAMRRLHLTCARTRMRYGERAWTVRSRFLEEMEPAPQE